MSEFKVKFCPMWPEGVMRPRGCWSYAGTWGDVLKRMRWRKRHYAPMIAADPRRACPHCMGVKQADGHWWVRHRLYDCGRHAGKWKAVWVVDGVIT